MKTEGILEVTESVLFDPITTPTGVEGKMYFDTTQKKIGFYNGSEWTYI